MSKPKNPPKIEIETEEAWEEEVMNEALGDALNPDGSIDFNKLRAAGSAMNLDELYTEDDEDNEA